MAHVDTAKTYFLYHPGRVRGFRLAFLVNAGLAFLAFTALAWPLGLYFLLQAALLFHRGLSAPYVEGGNDNGSGVAVATALFLEAARKTPGARPVRYRLAYFDTLPLTQRGFSCLTLVRLEGGLLPDWHWPTDTFARLDEGALEGTLVYARSLLEKVFRES